MQRIRDRIVSMVREGWGDEMADKAAAGEPILVDKLDSLERLDFIAGVENIFDVCIPDVVTQDMKTVDDIAGYVGKITAGATHGSH